MRGAGFRLTRGKIINTLAICPLTAIERQEKRVHTAHLHDRAVICAITDLLRKPLKWAGAPITRKITTYLYYVSLLLLLLLLYIQDRTRARALSFHIERSEPRWEASAQKISAIIAEVRYPHRRERQSENAYPQKKDKYIVKRSFTRTSVL